MHLLTAAKAPSQRSIHNVKRLQIYSYTNSADRDGTQVDRKFAINCTASHDFLMCKSE